MLSIIAGLLLLLAPQPITQTLYLPLVQVRERNTMAITYQLITPDGVTFDFSSTDYNVTPGIPDGLGLPPVRHETAKVYNRPGASLRSINIDPRVVTITAWVAGSSQENLHIARAALMAALRWNRSIDNPPSPSHLRYTANGHSVDLGVYYAGDVTSSVPGTEKLQLIGIKLFAYDPLWYATAQTTTELVKSQNLSVSYLVGKYGGGWSAMGNGGTGAVYAIAASTDGDKVYVGGNFTNWAGIAAADYIACFTISTGTWSALGTGVDNIVYGLAINAAGELFATGLFHNAGGGAAAHIAKWNGSAWSALGTGLDNDGTSVSIGPDGSVYVGGYFANAGGGAAARIAKWNGSAWSALGTGANDIVYAVLATSTNNVYIGGAFTTAGGTTVNYVAKWNGSAWSALQTGLDGTVYALVELRDGDIVIGGGFATTADGRAFAYITRWNGSTFLNMNGPNFDVRSLAVASDGLLYAGGDFTSINGKTLPDKVAAFNGVNWAHLGIDLPGAPSVRALGIYNRNVFLGFNTSGTAVAGPSNTVTNNGSTDVYPVIKITGPGTLEKIENLLAVGNVIIGTQDMIFDMYVNPGETITIDLSPNVKTIISSWRGDMMPSLPLLPQSDFATFRLLPTYQVINGDNIILVKMSGTDANSSVQFKHYDAYLSADEACH